MADLTPTNEEELLKLSFLKYLDSFLSNDNNVICIWGTDDMTGLSIVEKEVTNSKAEKSFTTQLTVKFYVNNANQIVLTTIK